MITKDIEKEKEISFLLQLFQRNIFRDYFESQKIKFPAMRGSTPGSIENMLEHNTASVDNSTIMTYLYVKLKFLKT